MRKNPLKPFWMSQQLYCLCRSDVIFDRQYIYEHYLRLGKPVPPPSRMYSGCEHVKNIGFAMVAGQEVPVDNGGTPKNWDARWDNEAKTIANTLRRRKPFLISWKSWNQFVINLIYNTGRNSK